ARTWPVVGSAPLQPRAGAAERDEIRAVRLHPDGGETAEFLEARSERKPAAVLEHAELTARRVAVVEAVETLGGNLDRYRRVGNARGLCRAGNGGNREADAQGDGRRYERPGGEAPRPGRRGCASG